MYETNISKAVSLALMCVDMTAFKSVYMIVCSSAGDCSSTTPYKGRRFGTRNFYVCSRKVIFMNKNITEAKMNPGKFTNITLRISMQITTE